MSDTKSCPCHSGSVCTAGCAKGLHHDGCTATDHNDVEREATGRPLGYIPTWPLEVRNDAWIYDAKGERIAQYLGIDYTHTERRAHLDLLIERANAYDAHLATIAAQREVIETYHDAVIQALAYIASPARDDYQLSLVKSKAESKLHAALAKERGE